MDINDLNKTQFLLVILLVMLVTSITTATVTVTLMDQSPKASMVNTINRVVERVVPGATTTIVKIIKEEPTVINEGEQIVRVAEAVSQVVVKLDRKTEEGNKLLGTGFIVRPDLVATALSNLPEEAKEIIISQNNLSLSGEVIKRDQDNSIAFIKLSATNTLPVINLIYSQNLPTNGQTGIALAFSDSNSPEVMTGIVFGVVNTKSTTTATATSDIIRIGAVVGDAIGGPVFNTKGELIGIGISRGYALAASALRLLIDQIK